MKKREELSAKGDIRLETIKEVIKF